MVGIDLASIEKAFKKIEKDNSGILQEEESYLACERIPCSSPELAESMGGGWPHRRIIELFGPESSGKSNLTYLQGKDYQTAGFFVVYLDFEHSFDYDFARKQGLNTDPSVFKLIQPETIHEGFEIAEKLIIAGIGLLIVDSVSSMPTRTELDGDYDKASIGLQAKAMSTGLKKLTPIIADYSASVTFVNQIRMKIGVMFGSPETTSGGEALKFYSSLRGRTVRTGYIEESGDEKPIGYTQKITWVKNKTSRPKGVAELSVYYEKGVDNTGGIIDFACEANIITKGGGGNFTWIDHEGQEGKIRGKLKLIDYLKENPEFLTYIKVKLGLENPSEE